ncbi:TPA: hypothetical protein NIB05_006669, partial [Pseudomonas aeruginosa]|nr:hypothetical protein [Pseudomonas aeruginosa]HCF3860677.1 hypothetical protein [Pseudomonas aeruginosa]
SRFTLLVYLTLSHEVRRSLGFVQQVELGRDLGLRLSAEREFSHVGKPINEVKLELRWYYY